MTNDTVQVKVSDLTAIEFIVPMWHGLGCPACGGKEDMVDHNNGHHPRCWLWRAVGEDR